MSWGFNSPGTSQDAAKTIACCLVGVVKINTFVCNGRYIGKWGVHMNPAIYAETEDTKIRSFIPTRSPGSKRSMIVC